jgi:hypothetical protein
VSTCPRCDAAIGADDRFCLNCGQPLNEDAAVARPAVATDAGGEDGALALPAQEEPPGEVELVACPECGSSNAARRRSCGRCGRLLAAAPVPDEDRTGEVDVVASPDDAPAWTPARDDGDRVAAPQPRHRGLGVAVVGLGLVLGTGLGVAAATGMGPFATVEPVEFDAVAYPQEADLLEPATARSSSTATPDGARTFGPDQTVDGDLTTAWLPADEEDGALLQHGFVAPVWIDRLEVATGDQHDETTFSATGRVTEVRVDLGTHRLDVTLAPIDGVQLVRLPEPVLADEVTWEVVDTNGGVGAVSEVRYVGWQADEEDREAYRERR